MPNSAPGSARAALSIDYSTARAPSLVNRFVDYDLPKMLWSTWRPSYGKREIRRALLDHEHQAVALRVAELEIPTGPYSPREEDAVADAIMAMFQSFRSMKQGAEEAWMLTKGLLVVLAPYPRWAIEQGCYKIRSGEAYDSEGRRLKREFPPNDAEIVAVVKGILKPYYDALDSARALLAAPIEGK